MAIRGYGWLGVRVCVCVFVPSPDREGTLLMEVPGTPVGASFLEFELKPNGKVSADPTQHEFQHHIVGNYFENRTFL